MRFLINAVLAFVFVMFVSGLLPLSAQQMSRLHAMKGEFAAASGAQRVFLPPPGMH